MTALDENKGGNLSSLANSTDVELGLLDISVASLGVHCSEDFVTNVRALEPSLAGKVQQLTAKSGWAEDSIYMAAWLVVQSYLLGQSQVRLNQHREITDLGLDRKYPVLPPTDSLNETFEIARYQHAVGATSALHKLVECIDSERKRWRDTTCQPAVKDAALDHLWMPNGNVSQIQADKAPLVIGINHVTGPEDVSQTELVIASSGAAFAGELVDSILECMVEVLQAFVKSPQILIGDIDVLGIAGRQKVDGHANPNPLNHQYDPALSITSVFAKQVKTHGEKTALTWMSNGEIQTLSYRELDRRSNAAAKKLSALGCKPNSIVALALDRSKDAIVILLGILKIGAAYLPIDPKYPKDRIAFMLEDAAISHAVMTAESRLVFPDSISVIDAAELTAHQDGHERFGEIDQGTINGDALAYVMYTSGSTGEPKGIEICHRSIIRLVRNVDYVRLSADDVFLHAAPLGFDASTLEIWGPLLNGGTCAIYPEAVPSGAGIAQSIASHRVSSAWLTAALFNAVVDDDPSALHGLDQLLIGGEALSVAHVLRAQKALPHTTIINGYGPTECTTFTATYRIPRDLSVEIRSIPIGKPIPQTPVYIVNQRLELLPAGVVGELCVGGPGVARGYLRRPELNAERFITNPFVPTLGLLYRTGDLVRYLPDGNIEFVGRRDGQVKIRGFRIEVGEIEASLAKHPQVQSCAVIARNDRPGGTMLVAYFVPRSQTVSAAILRAHLYAELPDFMVPSVYVSLAKLPVTMNGKLDRRALPVPENNRPELAQPYAAAVTPSEARVCQLFSELLGLDRVGRLDNFFELGGSSLLVMQALSRLKKTQDAEISKANRLSSTVFFSDPTPAAIARVLDESGQNTFAESRLVRTRPTEQSDHNAQSEPIAIIAMTGRFPGATSVEALWDNLCTSKESITFFRDDELDASIPLFTRNDADYVKARGVIDDVEMFDAAFFGISPKEAELMDPQQRIFMELCWECLERGGYSPDSCPGPVGVFGGMYNASYFQKHVSRYPERVNAIGEFQVMLANEKDYITTRVANRLNLTGPAVSVHTACSTSLVAIVQAMINLRSRQCDMALAGGASITCPPRSGYLYQDGAMLSPDGHTRTFDANARGTVFSDGAAVVLLKRLSDAIADGDPIYAVIKGAAINNDGGAKASFTAPSVDGQAAVIAAAHDDAGVDARSISYVEAHGTATPLGDPVELAALTKAFKRHTNDNGFCKIGSIKSNLGHLVIAAGATGVIKTALALSKQSLPPTLHFDAPNPELDLPNSPFVVNDQTTAWMRGEVPRRAGVSSFGVGGTNAHAVLEEAPLRDASEVATGPQLFMLSARTPTALVSSVKRLAAHFELHTDDNLADAAYTLRVGRKSFANRTCIVTNSAADAVTTLRETESLRKIAGIVGAKIPDIAFMFPGQSAQYISMGATLYEHEPVFRIAFDDCLKAFDGQEGNQLKAIIFSTAADALIATSVTQPALFCIEYALAQYWLSLGVRPVALIGHSVGEFVAATIAGVFSLHDAVRLVARRGQLMQSQPTGAMLAVRAGVEAVQKRLSAPDFSSLCIAAENSPSLCVVAGPLDAVNSLKVALEKDGVISRQLQTSHAFHSAMMDAAVAPFEAEVRKVRLSPPSIPIFSTVTGKILLRESACDPHYWAMHLREPVRFSPALIEMLETVGDKNPLLLLEVGPRASLTTLARQHAASMQRTHNALGSLADEVDRERESLLLAVGRLWTMGVPVQLDSLDRRARKHRVLLPTYPFERQRFWLNALPVLPIPSQPAVPSSPVIYLPPVFVDSTKPMEQLMNTPPTQTTMAASPAQNRVLTLLAQLRTMLEDTSGVDLAEADGSAPFIELGLDSLSLTQIAIQLKQTFKISITFRQLMEKYRSLDSLAAFIDSELPVAPADVSVAPASNAAAFSPPMFQSMMGVPAMIASQGTSLPSTANPLIQQVIQQQMQLMAQQLLLLQGASPGLAAPSASVPAPAIAAAQASTTEKNEQAIAANPAPVLASEASSLEENPGAPMKYDVKKAFGAIARIYTDAASELTERQRARLDQFMRRYIARTKLSKEYTVAHRPHLADPRVVNGFRPMLKEIIYQIVISRSKGSRMWDLDGNEYIDVLNGFGMNMFGWQPQFINDAVKRQMDEGYDIGPQHPLAGEVAKLICEVTGHDRAGLCNTGSEAVMGAVRIARTVTGRNTIALFTGSYHGIFDEVIVRAAKKLRAVPAAPGIMASTAQNVLVLDYGTPESMKILREHADDLAAVLVEPVQSRRPDFQPREFLQELREVTKQSGTLLIFDEVVTGFRCHPGGIKALFGIDADICTYGKVVGGGFPIGVIAGKREFMDALDGGGWQYGDDSIPTVGVTYFAGTFVRHPLALAAAKVVLEHLKREGPTLQANLTFSTTAMVDELNAFCREMGAPIVLKSFASVWKTFFTEDHPLQDLLFGMMRSRGIHILDNFPCFFTTAHSVDDIAKIKTAFKESVVELQESGFIPKHKAAAAIALDASKPPAPGARIGKDPDGNAAWFVPNPESPGKYLRLDA
jgi:amino acid adenylation domain-containing protein